MLVSVRGVLSALSVAQCVVLLCCVSGVSASLTDEEIKSFVELNVKDVYKKHKVGI